MYDSIYLLIIFYTNKKSLYQICKMTFLYANYEYYNIILFKINI